MLKIICRDKGHLVKQKALLRSREKDILRLPRFKKRLRITSKIAKITKTTRNIHQASIKNKSPDKRRGSIEVIYGAKGCIGAPS